LDFFFAKTIYMKLLFLNKIYLFNGRKVGTGLAKEGAMNTRRFDEFESTVDELLELEDDAAEPSNPKTKLERRRQIEKMNEEKLLREELGEYDL